MERQETFKEHSADHQRWYNHLNIHLYSSVPPHADVSAVISLRRREKILLRFLRKHWTPNPISSSKECLWVTRHTNIHWHTRSPIHLWLEKAVTDSSVEADIMIGTGVLTSCRQLMYPLTLVAAKYFYGRDKLLQVNESRVQQIQLSFCSLYGDKELYFFRYNVRNGKSFKIISTCRSHHVSFKV